MPQAHDLPILRLHTDPQDRLRVQTSGDGYSQIYRAAAWVRWDNSSKEFYVVSEKEEGLAEQYSRIERVVFSECNEHLKITDATDFSGIPDDVIARIKASRN